MLQGRRVAARKTVLQSVDGDRSHAGQWNRASWGSIEGCGTRMCGSPPMAISQSVADVRERRKSCKTPASQPLAVRHLKSMTDDFGVGRDSYHRSITATPGLHQSAKGFRCNSQNFLRFQPVRHRPAASAWQRQLRHHQFALLREIMLAADTPRFCIISSNWR